MQKAIWVFLPHLILGQETRWVYFTASEPNLWFHASSRLIVYILYYHFVGLAYTSFMWCYAYTVISQDAMPAVTGIWLVVQQIVLTILFKLLRLVYTTVQCVNWHINGTARKLREARLPQNYERSAHVLDVVYLHKFSSMDNTSLSNFLYTHNRFENPQYIIDNDNVTLMDIDERNAIFCEAQEKGMLASKG